MTAARRTCRKRRFRNPYDAGKWLRRLETTRTRGNGTVKTPWRVYECHLCHGWHVTSQQPS